MNGDNLAGDRTLPTPGLQVGDEVGFLGRVEVEVRVVCGEEEERHVAPLEVLLEPPALDASEVSDQAVKDIVDGGMDRAWACSGVKPRDFISTVAR